MKSIVAPVLDLRADVTQLTADLCAIPSVSRQEATLADAVEQALRTLTCLQVFRTGNRVLARTMTEAAERVVLAGHLDTVPLVQQPHKAHLPPRIVDEVLYGRGSVDMKGGVAVLLSVAALVHDHLAAGKKLRRDITFVCYDCEEIEMEVNGLRALIADFPEWVQGDFAILLEPTCAQIEGGCKGTLRVDVQAKGVAAHSGRPWLGKNAIHQAAPILQRLNEFVTKSVVVDGLEYREGLNAVGIHGGIAGNVIPDECTVTVNYRFAPNKTEEEALQVVQDLFADYQITLTDMAPGARPGLGIPAAEDFVNTLQREVNAKQGWTDVAQFTKIGVPAVNFGPGDPALAHTDDEHCPLAEITQCQQDLAKWLL